MEIHPHYSKTSNGAGAESPAHLQLNVGGGWDSGLFSMCLCFRGCGGMEEEKAPVGHSWCATVWTFYLLLSYWQGGLPDWALSSAHAQILASYLDFPCLLFLSIRCVHLCSSFWLQLVSFSFCLTPYSYVHACQCRSCSSVLFFVYHPVSSLSNALWNQLCVLTLPGLPAPGKQAAPSHHIHLTASRPCQKDGPVRCTVYSLWVKLEFVYVLACMSWSHLFHLSQVKSDRLCMLTTCVHVTVYLLRRAGCQP